VDIHNGLYSIQKDPSQIPLWYISPNLMKTVHQDVVLMYQPSNKRNWNCCQVVDAHPEMPIHIDYKDSIKVQKGLLRKTLSHIDKSQD